MASNYLNDTCVIRYICQFGHTLEDIQLFATQFRSRRASSLMRKHMKRYTATNRISGFVGRATRVIDSYDDEEGL